MRGRVLAAMVAIALAISFSSAALAQEAAKKEMKKEEPATALKSVSCDPACGFMCRSHDEKELTMIVKEHAKAHHNMEMTDQQVKEKMREEKPMPEAIEKK